MYWFLAAGLSFCPVRTSVRPRISTTIRTSSSSPCYIPNFLAAPLAWISSSARRGTFFSLTVFWQAATGVACLLFSFRHAAGAWNAFSYHLTRAWHWAFIRDTGEQNIDRRCRLGGAALSGVSVIALSCWASFGQAAQFRRPWGGTSWTGIYTCSSCLASPGCLTSSDRDAFLVQALPFFCTFLKDFFFLITMSEARTSLLPVVPKRDCMCNWK